MTGNLAAASPKTLTADELKIVKRYASGMSLQSIAAEIGSTASRVFDVLHGLSALNRARSTELLRQHDQVTVRRLKTPPPAPIQVGRSFSGNAASSTTPVPVPTSPGKDLEIPDVTTPSTLEQLVRDAEASGMPAAVKLASRIRADGEQLASLIERYRAQENTRNTIARLEAQLASERRKLKEFRTVTRHVPPASGPGKEADNASVRAWAAEAGIPCPARGRIPADVLKAYAGANAGPS